MPDFDFSKAKPPTAQPQFDISKATPPNLAYRVEAQESRHNPNAVNPKSGAEGSMQTLPSTLRDPGYGVTPAKDNSPAEMTRVGKDYLSAMQKKYGGNETHALAAYNWGPAHVDNVLKNIKDPNEFTQHLPAETQNYITKIQGNKAPVQAPKFDITKAKPPQFDFSKVTPPAAPAQQGGAKEFLASVSEPAIKGGANLVSGMIAPFLSQKSLDILQKKGLYTPRESPVKEYSQAAYSTIMAPLNPVVDAVTGGAQKVGNETIGKEATNKAGDVLGTAMDVLGVAGLPGKRGAVRPAAEKVQAKPSTVETQMAELEKQHDASTDPAVQASIKDQMMKLANQYEPKAMAENAPSKSPEALKVEQKLVDLEKQHDASTDPKVQEKIKQQMMEVVNQHPDIKKAAAQPGAASQAAAAVRNVLSPESAGPKAADMATTIRAETGTANRNVAKAEAKLAESYKLANSMTPEQHADYYNYVEGRSSGETLKDPGLQKFADDTRDVMQSVRKEIENLPEGDKIGFYQDYFPHQFKNPEQARTFANNFVSRQGSSGNLKARKYPTLADANAAGLQLVDPNPVRAASKYVTSMNHYLASKHIATQIIDKGDAKYYIAGKQPEGWVPLTGRFAERTRSYMTGTEEEGNQAANAMHEKLYAPEEVARIYNNHYSRGVEGTDLAKPYELWRSANAANTAAELSLSAYHLATITGQLLASDMSRVLKNTLVGDWTGVAKAARSVSLGQIPFLKGSTYKVGGKLIKQYKGLKDYGLDMETIAEHFERGGGKVGQEKLYRGGEEGGFVTAKGGLPEAIRSIQEKAGEGVTGKARAALEVFQRATEDISYPLFEKYIPNIKTGAFANLMGDWIRQHPEASPSEIADARKHYVNLVDDRFGEMNMDNVFWHRYLKQLSSLFLRAQGWDIGLVRQAGGGVLDTVKILKDAFKGKKPDAKLLDRPAFLAGVIGTMGLTAAAYQYLKTGKSPDQMLDYFAPRTGGTSTRGTPERTVLPFAAHGRELLHMAAPYAAEGALGTESPLSGVTQEMSNKIASLPRNITQAYENEDYFGGKIAPTTGDYGWAGSIPARAEHVAAGFAPFSLTGQGDKLQGSNLSAFERRMLGMRPAGMEIADPENFKQMRWAQEIKKEAKQYKTDARKEGEKAK